MNINAHTELFCLLGNPSRHSLSPLIHNAAFGEKGINAVYLAFEPRDLDGAIKAIRSLPIKGVSVTIPYKTDIIQFLDHIDPLAEKIGSVNTLIYDNYTIKGYNTDGFGALRAIKEFIKDVNQKHVLIIGNGGSARAIAFTLLQEGATITISGRNLERVERLVKDLSRYYTGIRSLLLSSCTLDYLKNVHIIINTTPVGMSPHDRDIPLDPSLLMPEHCVMDIVYSPPYTRLLEEAEKINCSIIEGRYMLLYQGARQFELWTGVDAPIDTMKKVLFDHTTPNITIDEP